MIIFAWVLLTCAFFVLREVINIAVKDLLINEAIRDREVRLIDENGDQVGIVPNREAQDRARDARLDLVLVSPQANPPVAKILDYGKYRYEMEKSAKEARKQQQTIEVKEVRFSPNIQEHDLNVRARQAERFLKSGDHVKVSVRFRGREMGHTDLGREVLEQFVDILGDVATVDKKPRMEGRNMTMFLVPNRDK